MSDTRTNAGVDDISSVKKLHSWEVEGDRVITIMTAGNLATTQALISIVSERLTHPKDGETTIMNAPTMFQVAQIIGNTLRSIIMKANEQNGNESGSVFNASIILGGQIKGMPPRLFMIYPEGNFIESSPDNPFFPIGETKYGRPIIVRAYDPDMNFEEAMKLFLVSFDSTIKSNLSVGLPLDYQVYEVDSFKIEKTGRIDGKNPYFREVSDNWGHALQAAFNELPEYKFN